MELWLASRASVCRGVIDIKETDLYEPIKTLLEKQGFLVKGEVKNCDIAALFGDELWVVEMKRSLSMGLLYQAMSRLSITPHVFVAIPRPKRSDKDFLIAQRILKKLELGLITVALDSPVKFAEIILFPAETKKRKPSKKSAAIRNEIEKRIGDTPGGSRGLTITSAYRERCIKIACLLEHNKDLSPKELVQKYGCEKDSGLILQKNYYGWYYRVTRGRYALSDTGRKFLSENANNPAVIYYKKGALQGF